MTDLEEVPTPDEQPEPTPTWFSPFSISLGEVTVTTGSTETTDA